MSVKAIRFSKKYGIRDGVLDGRITQARRLVKGDEAIEQLTKLERDGKLQTHYAQKAINYHAEYAVGEEVAVLQPYSELIDNKDFLFLCEAFNENIDMIKTRRGWYYDRFVRYNLMPHHIRITDVKVARLRDITEEDSSTEYNKPKKEATPIVKNFFKILYKANPLVFIYSFELID